MIKGRKRLKSLKDLGVDKHGNTIVLHSTKGFRRISAKRAKFYFPKAK